MNAKPRKVSLPVAVLSTVVALVGVVLVLLYARWMSERILPGANRAHTTNMQPVDLLLLDVEKGGVLRLRVPKAYLTKASTWSGGKQRFISMETQLPALQPTPAIPPPPLPDSPEYARWLAESNEGIYITLENTYVSSSASDIRERWLKSYAVDRNRGSPNAYELISDAPPGLVGYKALACSNLEYTATGSVAETEWKCQDASREDYVSKEGDPTVHFFCNMNGATGIWRARMGCQVDTTFHGLALRYIFRHSQLDRWQEFDSGVRRLLESFVVPD
jgi:hypothetical protein